MKKAKIFLTALTVLAVVGGTLAFKLIPGQIIGQCDTRPTVLKCTLNSKLATFNNSPTGLLIDYDFTYNNCVFDGQTWICTTRTVDE